MFVWQTYRHTVFVDAFIMMYSISDEASFRFILREVSRLRERMDVDRPIIMVANKMDLNRTRAVSASGTIKKRTQVQGEDTELCDK